MSAPRETNWSWLRNGDEAFPAMLAAIAAAEKTVCLEIYIFADSSLGKKFLAALLDARKRGVTVRVLVDAGGSLTLPDSFFQPLRAAGGVAKFFNPITLQRMGIRNHRKLLVCDGQVAFIGGFNIAPEYEGDGVARGWCDLGMRLEGPLVAQLAASFDEMLALAEFRHKPFARFRRFALKRTSSTSTEQLLLSGPGRGFNPIRQALQKDLHRAQTAQIIAAYFLPTGKLWRAFGRVARRGGTMQLVLAGKSDVALSQMAAQGLYLRLLKAGAEIHEYEPQILHAKLFVVDDVVYVGSANLDPRSLGINYELMLRFENPKMAAEAREIFGSALQHSQQISLPEWRRTQSLWSRLKRRWAFFILARIDPYLARRQWRRLRDQVG